MVDRQWFAEGVQVFETGTEEYFVEGVQFNEDQEDAVVGGLLRHPGMSGGMPDMTGGIRA